MEEFFTPDIRLKVNAAGIVTHINMLTGPGLDVWRSLNSDMLKDLSVDAFKNVLWSIDHNICIETIHEEEEDES